MQFLFDNIFIFELGFGIMVVSSLITMITVVFIFLDRSTDSTKNTD